MLSSKEGEWSNILARLTDLAPSPHGNMGALFVSYPCYYREEGRDMMDIIFGVLAVAAIIGVGWYTKKYGR